MRAHQAEAVSDWLNPLSLGTMSASASYIENLAYTGLEIYISRRWTIGPPALEILWSCQISGGLDVANCIFFWQNQTQLTEFTFSHTRLIYIYEKTLQYTFIEKDMTLVKKVFVYI